MITQQHYHDFGAVTDSMRDGPVLRPLNNGLPPMDLAKIFEYVRRRIRLIVQCILVGGGLSAASGLLVGPTFTATALLAVAEPDDGARGQATDSAVDTQIAMMQSQAFLERAYHALAADPALGAVAPSASALERRMKILQASKSRLIAVSFSAKSPSIAADAVNRIVRLYVEDPELQSVQSVDDATAQNVARIKALEAKLASLTKDDLDAGSTANPNANLLAEESLRDQIATLKLNENLVRRRQETRRQALAMTPPVQLVALADPPTRRSSLNPLLIAAPGTLFSALLGIGLAVTIGRLDRRIYSREQLEAVVRHRCAGEIPPERSKSAKRKRSLAEPHLAYVRAIEAVVTQTILLPTPRPKIVLLASSEADPSEAQIVADFAAAAARVTPRVLLIDLDFSRMAPRQPLLQRLFGRGGEGQRYDVFDVLADRRTFDEAIGERNTQGYFFLPLRSPILDDPFSMLASDRLGRLLDSLPGSFDLILIGGPPMSGMHETQIIATFVDAAVVFVRTGVTKEPAVLEAFAAAGQSLGLSSMNGRARLWSALVEARAHVQPPGLLSVAARLARRSLDQTSVQSESAPLLRPSQPKTPVKATAEGSLS